MKRLLSTVLGVSLLALVAPVTASADGQVTPIVDCHMSQPNGSGGTLITEFFGYTSTFTSDTVFPIGPGNFFSPPPFDRGQPTTFQPGVFHRVFSATWTKPTDSSITWNLGGGSVTDDGTQSPNCTPNTILNGAGAPPDTLGNDGDFYIDTTNHIMYGPKVTGTWPTPGVSLVGPPGTNGTNGTNGNTVLHGSGAPADSLGANGDFYVDTTHQVLYGPKTNGHWPTPGVSLVGPPGTIVCNNNIVARVICSVLFAPGTFKSASKVHAAFYRLTHGHRVVAQGRASIENNRVALRALPHLRHGSYRLTISTGRARHRHPLFSRIVTVA